MEIWYRDFFTFIDVKHMLIFYPTSDMSYNEKLNSVVRLSMYTSLVLYSFYNDSRMFFLFFLTCLITYMMSYYEENKERYVVEDPEEQEEYVERCTKPTRENPFMNVLMHEYTENPKRGKACNLKGVDKYVDEYFDDNLYRSIDDIYNKNASDRQYYTMPYTEIPNDQDRFAQWLYGIEDKTCKEGNGLKCKYFS